MGDGRRRQSMIWRTRKLVTHTACRTEFLVRSNDTRESCFKITHSRILLPHLLHMHADNSAFVSCFSMVVRASHRVLDKV